ncbi:Peptidase C13 family protein [compost metagenome]
MIGTDGSHYIGHFNDWRFSGQGRLNLADGSFYTGQFDNDSYQGRGTLVLTDGTVLSGTWINGQRVRDAEGKLLPDTLELGLLAQGRLLDAALANIPPSTPAVELYSLTLGGDGKQSVFLRESDYVANMLTTRFGTLGQIRLVNHRDHLADRPMATRENLRRAALALAERSGPEDLIFIYLTSHGTSEHELVLDQPRMELADLPADELAAVLAPLKNRDKVIVISSCYSGGFIPALKDERTLLMTASRADRVSFGCSEEANFTYFGDALFVQALNQTDDLEQAFKRAKATVAERELADGFEASEPQIWAPKTVLSHWQLLRKQQARKALQSASMQSKDANSN